MRIAESARQSWDDLERRMRQRWRIYPERKYSGHSRQATQFDDVFCADQPHRINPGDILEMMVRADISPDAETPVAPTPEEKKPIVSINGKDVDENELEDTKREKAA